MKNHSSTNKDRRFTFGLQDQMSQNSFAKKLESKMQETTPTFQEPKKPAKKGIIIKDNAKPNKTKKRSGFVDVPESKNKKSTKRKNRKMYRQKTPFPTTSPKRFNYDNKKEESKKQP